MRIRAFHILNDFSGSPKVLEMALRGLAARGHYVELCTSRGGVLDSLTDAGVDVRYFSYKFSSNLPLTALRMLVAQMRMFGMAFACGRKNTTVLVNTILPVGAALGAWMGGARVVYYYHENAYIKSAFYRVLAKCMLRFARRILCVSDFQRSYLPSDSPAVVVPNALPASMSSALVYDSESAYARRTVLMVGSLKRYKGVNEFYAIAAGMEDVRFILVVNDTEENIAAYEERFGLQRPANLAVYPRQSDIAQFYNRASVVLNLTDRREVVETFGLTALEAMTAGLPVVVPTEGGVAELVTDGSEGFKIDVANGIAPFIEHLRMMLDNREIYMRMAACARAKAAGYSEDEYIKNFEKQLSDEQ